MQLWAALRCAPSRFPSNKENQDKPTPTQESLYTQMKVVVACLVANLIYSSYIGPMKCVLGENWTRESASLQDLSNPFRIKQASGKPFVAEQY